MKKIIFLLIGLWFSAPIFAQETITTVSPTNASSTFKSQIRKISGIVLEGSEFCHYLNTSGSIELCTDNDTIRFQRLKDDQWEAVVVKGIKLDKIGILDTVITHALDSLELIFTKEKTLHDSIYFVDKDQKLLLKDYFDTIRSQSDNLVLGNNSATIDLITNGEVNKLNLDFDSTVIKIGSDSILVADGSYVKSKVPVNVNSIIFNELEESEIPTKIGSIYMYDDSIRQKSSTSIENLTGGTSDITVNAGTKGQLLYYTGTDEVAGAELTQDDDGHISLGSPENTSGLLNISHTTGESWFNSLYPHLYLESDQGWVSFFAMRRQNDVTWALGQQETSKDDLDGTYIASTYDQLYSKENGEVYATPKFNMADSLDITKSLSVTGNTNLTDTLFANKPIIGSDSIVGLSGQRLEGDLEVNRTTNLKGELNVGADETNPIVTIDEDNNFIFRGGSDNTYANIGDGSDIDGTFAITGLWQNTGDDMSEVSNYPMIIQNTGANNYWSGIGFMCNNYDESQLGAYIKYKRTSSYNYGSLSLGVKITNTDGEAPTEMINMDADGVAINDDLSISGVTNLEDTLKLSKPLIANDSIIGLSGQRVEGDLTVGGNLNIKGTISSSDKAYFSAEMTSNAAATLVTFEEGRSNNIDFDESNGSFTLSPGMYFVEAIVGYSMSNSSSSARSYIGLTTDGAQSSAASEITGISIATLIPTRYTSYYIMPSNTVSGILIPTEETTYYVRKYIVSGSATVNDNMSVINVFQIN